jgi:hypothetical protein
MPVYEHGINCTKNHQLVIGPHRVEWKDFPFGQNTNHKQNILKHLKKDNPFVVLAHPRWNNAYTPSDLEKLTDYDAIEVLNHFKLSDQQWDQALSAGRAVWGLGGDDAHQVGKGKNGLCWTMINAKSTTKEDILEALHHGCMYAVRGRYGFNDNSLRKVEIIDNRLIVQCERPALEIRFIGQGGKVQKIVVNSEHAEIDLKPEDTYIRTEICCDRSEIFLNPVIRYEKGALPKYSAMVDMTKTWILRVIFLLGAGAAFLMIRRKCISFKWKKFFHA